MNFYSCFDKQGKIIARCQTIQDIEVLKKMGRPIVEVKEMMLFDWCNVMVGESVIFGFILATK